jgi:uncharacterized protein (TIGR00255 family)
MTGFASATGSLPPHSWSWDLRSVNGKGQDLRLRVPDWITGLEAGLRKKLADRTARGNITLSLRLSRDESTAPVQVNPGQLSAVIAAMARIEAEAMEAGLSLAPSRAADIAAMRGVLDAGSIEDDAAPLAQHLLREADALISTFDAMRESEGAAIEEMLTRQLDDIEALTREARALADARSADTATALRRNLARVLENSDGADEARVAQELALIALKADVTEEIDRLRAHITAARSLISEGGPVGRKLDFLTQEFNREANTLCSKAQNTDLTRCGLALKAVIDQMREQVQNVE